MDVSGDVQKWERRGAGDAWMSAFVVPLAGPTQEVARALSDKAASHGRAGTAMEQPAVVLSRQ